MDHRCSSPARERGLGGVGGDRDTFGLPAGLRRRLNAVAETLSASSAGPRAPLKASAFSSVPTRVGGIAPPSPCTSLGTLPDLPRRPYLESGKDRFAPANAVSFSGRCGLCE